MRRRWTWLEIGVVGMVVVFLVFSLMPVHYGHGISSSQTRCLSNAKQLAIGMSMYATDYDDRFPSGDHWNATLKPYVKWNEVFHCPEGGRGIRYGYGMHQSMALAKLAKVDDPAARLLLFEAVTRIPDCVGDESLLPRPGRHRGRNATAYADGHARMVATR